MFYECKNSRWARVAAKYISQVKVCNLKTIDNCQSGKAELRISAYPYPDYGTLKGTVRAIIADTVGANRSQKILVQST
ncbi:hypothetical protein NIES2101_15175 [Calothrix sp. HK-06]|nr:hypothetical protein NIES2101_15175 [Calothrix sp. HK-06]